MISATGFLEMPGVFKNEGSSRSCGMLFPYMTHKSAKRTRT
jgi:hypothetical protein